jgi:hypothetical protein
MNFGDFHLESRRKGRAADDVSGSDVALPTDSRYEYARN